ncbi:MAG: FHA domain-containing protein [Fimbriimonadaceae bacterium]|nr:FHA domain-containing protein [Fimbriimonadaceae bacterium]
MKQPLLRSTPTALILLAPVLARAQDANEGGGSSLLVPILGGLLVVAIAVIAYLAMRSKGASPSSSVPAPRPTSAPASGEEEGTQVRVVGHRLVRLHGGVKVGAEYPVINTVTVGRDKTCTISLADPEMSGVHAEIQVVHGKAYVTDKASTNGTFVNDGRIDPDVPVSLVEGDKIKLGGTILLYQAGR